MPVSRIDFAHGAPHRLRMACHTAARHAQAGHRLVVYCTDAQRLHRFDALLWAFEPASFIPHALATDPIASLADVILAQDAAMLDSLIPADWLLNLDLECPPQVERFPRVLEIVSRHEADIQAARLRWASYQKAGHEMHSHKL